MKKRLTCYFELGMQAHVLKIGYFEICKNEEKQKY